MLNASPALTFELAAERTTATPSGGKSLSGRLAERPDSAVTLASGNGVSAFREVQSEPFTCGVAAVRIPR